MGSLFDLFAADAAGALDLSSVPDDQRTSRLRTRAMELVEAEARLARAEKLVEDIKARRELLRMRVLPEMMDEAQTDTLGLPSAGVDIVVQPYVFASIPKDWEEQQRDQAFEELERHGGGALPQATVMVKFPKEDLPRAKKLAEALGVWLTKAYGNDTPPPVALDLTVHHGMLTSWLKAELERREVLMAEGHAVKPLFLEKLGATVGRICRIKKRKEKAVSSRGKRR